MADYHYSHTRTEHPDAANFERHCHTEYELLFVLHGRGDFIVEGTRYPLRDGTLLLTRPQEYHYVRPETEALYERYVVNFRRDFIIGAASDLPILSAREDSDRGIYSASESVIPLLRQSFSLLDRLGRNAIPDLRETLLQTVVTQAVTALFLQGPDRENASGNETVFALIDYINHHLTEDLSLDRLATLHFIGKYQLCRLFRAHTGMSILHYVNTKRRRMVAGGCACGRSGTSGRLPRLFRVLPPICRHSGEISCRSHKREVRGDGKPPTGTGGMTWDFLIRFTNKTSRPMPSRSISAFAGKLQKKNPVSEETGQGTAICILIGKEAFYDAGRSCLCPDRSGSVPKGSLQPPSRYSSPPFRGRSAEVRGCLPLRSGF